MSLRTLIMLLVPFGLLAGVASALAQKDDKPPATPNQPPPNSQQPTARGDVVFFGGPGGPMGGQQRQILKQFDQNSDGWLNQEERQAARKWLKENPPNRGGPRGPGGPGGMMRMDGFGPGQHLVKPVLEAADADKDGSLTHDELSAGLKKLFAEFDKDRKESLDEKQLSEGLSRVVPAPQVFFAPGGAGGWVPGAGGPPAGAGAPPPGAGAPPAKGGTPQPPPAGTPPPGGPGGGQFFTFGPPRLDGQLAGEIMKRADANKDGKLTLSELTTAAEALFKEVDKDKDGKLDEKELGPGVALLMPMPKFTMMGGGPGGREPGKPGPRVAQSDVKSYPDAGLYEPTVLRTLFLEFEDKDWEAQLAEFHGTDVEVPATLTVDGKKYPNVGLRFRGMSSYGGVPAGSKRSLNVAIDLADPQQRLHGYKTLNLLNAHQDPSFLHTALYSHIARQYLPAPNANLVKVVINGESWGVYSNAQQFDKVFVKECFKDDKGARWKSSVGGGGLDYLGDKLEDYKRRYEIKSGDNDKDWKALAELCRVLNQTPPDQLEAALKPILDIDGALKFLALDIALINGDGYWTRGSDFSIYRDSKGVFHIIPHDMNEAFGPGFGGMIMIGGPGGPGGRPGGPGGPGGGPGPRPPGPGGPGPGGPGGFGPPGRGGIELDPLSGLDDTRKPLRSKLLAVPSLKARYLQYIRAIAEDSLDWNKLGPVVEQYRKLIEREVEADTRKLSSYDAFKKVVGTEPVAEVAQVAQAGPPAPHGGMSLKAFADQRRKYLLNHAEIKKLAAAATGEAKKGGEE